MTDPSLYRDDSRVPEVLGKVKAIADTLPPEPTTPPLNMEEYL